MASLARSPSPTGAPATPPPALLPIIPNAGASRSICISRTFRSFHIHLHYVCSLCLESLPMLPRHHSLKSPSTLECLSFSKATEPSLFWNPGLSHSRGQESNVCSRRTKAASSGCWKGHHASPPHPGCPLPTHHQRLPLWLTHLQRGERGFPVQGDMPRGCVPLPAQAPKGRRGRNGTCLLPGHLGEAPTAAQRPDTHGTWS